MIERTDNGLWALPGGAQDIGESVVEAAQRKVIEETGIEIEITGLSGIYSDPRHVIAYNNGEVRQEFSICFLAKMTGGELRTSSESRQARRVPASQLENQNMHPSMRLRVVHGLQGRKIPYLG
jgi:ADP-ribose pyrophosphatase YjhB (NUDIX family)